MTDPEELDEDLFADLYEGDEAPSKPTQSAPVAKSELPEPAKAAEEPAPSTASNGVGGGDNSAMKQEAASEGGDYDMNGGGWNANASQSYDHAPADDDDNYGPINVKEDGHDRAAQQEANVAALFRYIQYSDPRISPGQVWPGT
ncbi:uncharacterized protein BDR25DRAFT_309018 [Lindgomyces ingoldianus]|uniref:Uncharacterized protein n=1 Tax=Lindgomyces ingoldianus TaxID=673940 RepID=A0ACB6RIQ7_9PLEO|nr:uncharacterized protein BDR25DRAFT_309018 [Lindgomyces ingoldianus]KAF2478220.1 hypothetical protein BDR25DRAFT_309018 [Lindgomyces ingoldianus]